ncbi:MAG: HDOD domain-containing protein [Gammaproteobacteria bacterium]
MDFAATVAKALKESGIAHKVIRHPETHSLEQAAEVSGIAPEQVARAVLLRDEQGVVMAVLPLNRLIDFSALKNATSRNLIPVSHGPADQILQDCAPGSIPPLGPHYGIPTVVDESLMLVPEVYFEPGNKGTLVGTSREGFRILMKGAKLRRFGESAEQLNGSAAHDFLVPDDADLHRRLKSLAPISDVQAVVQSVDTLPAMPEMAHELLLLRNNPKANARDLAAIVERDPSLAAQIVRYARSPFFGYRGRIDSLHEAISRVLGFDTVMNMTLGIAAGRGFQIPRDGPIGLNAFWRHSVHAAALMQLLSGVLPKKIRPRPGVAYLAGLLHNFGQMLLGHLYPAHFYVLNKLVACNPDVPLGVIERRVLGQHENGNGNGHNDVNHAVLGAELLAFWNIPEEIVLTARFHHNESYHGEGAVLPNLAFVSNQLLKRHGIGDESDTTLSRSLLTALGLEEAMANALLERLMEGNDQLEQISRDLAA